MEIRATLVQTKEHRICKRCWNCSIIQRATLHAPYLRSSFEWWFFYFQGPGWTVERHQTSARQRPGYLGGSNFRLERGEGGGGLRVVYNLSSYCEMLNGDFDRFISWIVHKWLSLLSDLIGVVLYSRGTEVTLEMHFIFSCNEQRNTMQHVARNKSLK